MPRTKESVALAYKFLRSEAGRAAFDDGWGSALWHFVADHARPPSAAEIEDLRRVAAAIAECLPGWPASAREAYLAKAQRLKEECYGRDRA